MVEWSGYIQDPDMLMLTRETLFTDDMLPLYIKWMGLTDGMQILDVGCGTGLFSFYLARGLANCRFVGIDTDKLFLRCARESALQRGSPHSFTFLEGDAQRLPFADGTFDAVVSHTVLTNLPDPLTALTEMKRVTKPRGRVGAVVSEALDHIPSHPGYWPQEKYPFLAELRQISDKVHAAYDRLLPLRSVLNETVPAELPHMFVRAGFWNITMHSAGRAFSPSSADVPPEQRQRYWMLFCRSALNKLSSYRRLPGFSQYVTDQEAERYCELMQMLCDAQLKDLAENRIWEWCGGANLILSGTVPEPLHAFAGLFGESGPF